MRLSTAKIQNATAQKKTVRLFDGRGLYLEIAPTGSRWWRFKHRFAGMEKRISLGVYPDVGLKKARDRRDEMRKLVADGIDPSAARKQQKLMALDAAANTFEAIAREWFEKHSANWEASYSVKLLARLEANVFPWLGDRPIRDIKAPELLLVMRRVECRGVLETAHRLMNYCGNLEPLDLMARLAALVPKPRMHLTRYHGVFAPHSQHRAAVTPAQRGRGAPRPPASDADPAKVSTPRHVAMSWARRLKRVFDVEIESCTRCGGELKIIASIEEPQLIAKILPHRERTAPEQSQSELPLGARGPPAQSSLL